MTADKAAKDREKDKGKEVAGMVVKVINDNGTIYLIQGMFGHPLGTLAAARKIIKRYLQALTEPADCNLEATLRGVARRLRDSELDPDTATLAQIKAAIEGSEIDA